MSPIAREPTRDYFLMPIPPTPNGRLHLGHMAGPYLRMDMLGRHLRSRGHRVTVVSGSDGFDSYVVWKGQQQDRAAEAVVREYHAQIEQDLAALDIEVHDFLNVVDGPLAERHAEAARATVAALVAQGSTVTVVEKVPYCPATDRYIVGAWLVGNCPACDAGSAGYFCEACGAHFKPEAMRNPRPRLGDAPIEWRDVESLFLRISDVDRVLAHNRQAGASSDMIAVIQRYLAAEGPFFRLTAPGRWGVSWPADRWGNPRVLFEGGWEYSLSCGSRAAEQVGVAHPMRATSGVTTAVSFGIDNAILLLFGSTALMQALPGHKPFDHILTNYFYSLQGAKFSTSRLHVIWTSDIVDKTPATSDAVRYFLARENPEHGPANFAIEQFVACVNDRLVAGLQTAVEGALAALPPRAPAPPSAELIGRIEDAVAQLARALDPHAVTVAAAVRVIEAWVDARSGAGADARSPGDSYAWLACLAYLTAPVMPRFAAALWHALGHDGPVLRERLLVGAAPRGWSGARPFAPLGLASLAPCLPESLRAELARHA